jgi:hypothetical protein
VDVVEDGVGGGEDEGLADLYADDVGDVLAVDLVELGVYLVQDIVYGRLRAVAWRLNHGRGSS